MKEFVVKKQPGKKSGSHTFSIQAHNRRDGFRNRSRQEYLVFIRYLNHDRKPGHQWSGVEGLIILRFYSQVQIRNLILILMVIIQFATMMYLQNG